MAEKLRQKITEKYAIYNDDCVNVIKGLPDESVGFSISSPPFADLFAYSDSDADMGNCRSYKEFFVQFNFLVKELHRVIMPGRVVAMHCMDLPIHKGKEGRIGIRDFSGDIIRCFEKNDFIFHSRHCIWKDPLIAATRTKTLGLAHKQIVKDSSKCRTGIPDYIVAFRKDGENPRPIAHPRGLTHYPGEREVPRNLEKYLEDDPDNPYDPRTDKRSHWIWQQFASPVWFDIRQTRVLPYRRARDVDDEKHICPLQLDCIERCLILWSMEGDVVFTPFLGVGSEIYESVRLGRKGVGAELKNSYFMQAVRNLEMLETKQEMYSSNFDS